MDDGNVIRTLRGQAWQRAKGEMNALLETFWADFDAYERMRDEIDKFVKYVEDHGMQE